MSNDIFVIANMAGGPDTGSEAGKAEEELITPARAADESDFITDTNHTN